MTLFISVSLGILGGALAGGLASVIDKKTDYYVDKQTWVLEDDSEEPKQNELGETKYVPVAANTERATPN